MFGISFEHILIVGVILIVLGPKRLPEMGNSVGKAIRNFKDSIAGMTEDHTPKPSEQPAPAPQIQIAASTSEPVSPVLTPVSQPEAVPTVKKSDSGESTS